MHAILFSGNWKKHSDTSAIFKHIKNFIPLANWHKIPDLKCLKTKYIKPLQNYNSAFEVYFGKKFNLCPFINHRLF